MSSDLDVLASDRSCRPSRKGPLFVFMALVLLTDLARGAAPIHVVMIVADSLRWDVLGGNGGAARTPNLDWLARRGTRFDNAHSTAACTMPSSVALFTGNHSSTYCVRKFKPYRRAPSPYSYFVPAEEELYAETLSAHGYDCAMSVENVVASCSNNLQGFRALGSYASLDARQVDMVEKTCGINNAGWNPNFNYSCKYDYLYSFLHAILTAPPERPFFLLKWFFAPHIPYVAPEPFLAKLAPLARRMKKPLLTYAHIGYNELQRMSPEHRDIIMKPLYLASVESLDERVGFILKALRARRLLEKTLIVVTADHGEYFGEHGFYGHEKAFFEPVLHVPLVIAGPGIPAKRRETANVSLLDLVPTLADMLGIPSRQSMQGRSVAPLLRGQPLKKQEAYFDGLTNPQLEQRCDGLLADGWKLIVDRRGGHPVMTLYDLTSDPQELRPQVGPDWRRQSLLKRILELRRENKRRLVQNAERMLKTPLDAVDWSAQRQLLKSLGYIQDQP